MAVIYEARCSACNYSPMRMDDGYLALIVGDPGNSSFAHPEDSRLVIVAHPVEHMVLDQFGESYRSAGLGGRLLEIQNVICANCGTFYELRRLTADFKTLGCQPLLFPLAVACVLGGLVAWRADSICLGFFVGWLSILMNLYVLDLVTDRLVRRRFANRCKEFDRRADCPKCGSRRYARIRWRLRPLPCARCGKRALRITYYGKS